MADDVKIFHKEDLPLCAFPVLEDIRRQGKLCDVTLKVFLSLQPLIEKHILIMVRNEQIKKIIVTSKTFSKVGRSAIRHLPIMPSTIISSLIRMPICVFTKLK